METIKKQRIAVALRSYCDRYGSQSKAAKALKMSTAMISQMLTGDWDKIDDRQWHTAAAGIGYKEEKWEAVETAVFSRLSAILADAQENSLVMSIVGAAGTGKSFTCRHYAETHRDAFVLSCDCYWSRKDLLEELLTVMGEDTAGMTIAVEPMIALGTWKVYIAGNDWTAITRDGKPCSHYEHTLLITEGEPEILSYPGAKVGGHVNV